MVHGEHAGLVWQIWLYWSQVSVTMKQTLKLFRKSIVLTFIMTGVYKSLLKWEEFEELKNNYK